MAKLLGSVVRDTGWLHLVVGDTKALAAWKGSREASYARFARGELRVSVPRDGRRVLLDLGEAGQALVASVDDGLVLGAYYPAAKVLASHRAAAATALGQPIAVSAKKVGTVTFHEKSVSLGWALEALGDDAVRVSLKPGAYDLYADDTELKGRYGTIDGRILVVPAGEQPARASSAAAPSAALLGSFAPGTGRIEAMVSSGEGALRWSSVLAQQAFALVGADRNVNPLPGACVLRAGTSVCAYAHLMVANEVHIISRADGSLVVAPAFPSGGHGSDVKVDQAFIDSVSGALVKAKKVGVLSLDDGVLVVAWAHEVGLRRAQVDAVRTTRKAKSFSQGVAMPVTAGDYELWFEQQPLRASWGRLDTRCVLMPKR